MIETLTERRRRLLRDEIASIAIELFVDLGYDAVTVDDIASAAGTSPRSVFRYFTSKDDIVLDLVHRLDRRFVEALEARPATEGAVTGMRNAYLSTSSVAPGDHARIVQLARVLAPSSSLRDRARGRHVGGNDDVVAWAAGRMGLRRDDRRARVLVTAMSAVATTEFHRWAESGGRGNPSDAIAAALDVIELGLAPLDQLRPRRTRR